MIYTDVLPIEGGTQGSCQHLSGWPLTGPERLVVNDRNGRAAVQWFPRLWPTSACPVSDGYGEKVVLTHRPAAVTAAEVFSLYNIGLSFP